VRNLPSWPKVESIAYCAGCLAFLLGPSLLVYNVSGRSKALPFGPVDGVEHALLIWMHLTASLRQ